MALQHSIRARITLLSLVLSLICIWCAGYYLVDTLKRDMEQLLAEEQRATVSIIANQVETALNNRFLALENVAARSAEALQAGRSEMQLLLDNRDLLRILFNGGVIAHDAQGTAIAEVPQPAQRLGINYLADESVSTAIKQGTRATGRPVPGKILRAPVFGMAVPIRDARGNVIGALTGVTNLSKPSFLDDITKALYGKTGGYLLVASQDQLVLIASDKSRVMETIALATQNKSRRELLRGKANSGIYVNSRGVEVLGSAAVIPASGWVLLAELPTAELYAPIREMQSRALLAVLVLSLLAGAASWWVIGRQLKPLGVAARTLAMYPNPGPLPPPLPIDRPDEIGQLVARINSLVRSNMAREQSLRQSEAFKDVILNSLAAEIAVLDRTGVIRAVNDPWLRFSQANGDIAGATAINTGVGANYLDACKADGGPGSEQALQARDGIRAVLEGRLPSFHLEYPCHSPAEYRWFTMMVMPLGDGGEEGVVITHTDITAVKLAENDLRIAAVAFECQEGMLVLDAGRNILKTNAAFSRLTGFGPSEILGKAPDFLSAAPQGATSHEGVWTATDGTGIWQGELPLLRKDGEEFPAWVTVTAVRDASARTTHYVYTMTDLTAQRRREAERQAAELAQRNALIREVHHRIKNNLQGIVGVLRLYIQSYPLVAAPLNQTISQVRSLAVLHGLQGSSPKGDVQIGDLATAIVSENQSVWQTPIALDVPESWVSFFITEPEAVPVALILNELIVNAVKHGGKAHGRVSVTLRDVPANGSVVVCVRNPGQLSRIPDPEETKRGTQLGLLLIRSLMPRTGAQLESHQQGEDVVVCLTLAPPVIF